MFKILFVIALFGLLSFLLIFTFTRNYSVTVKAATDGLIGYWKFDESVIGAPVADYSGESNNGTVLGTPGALPKTDKAPVYFDNLGSLEFVGADYVEVADAPGLNPADLSLSVWVKFNSMPSSTQTVVAKWQDTLKQQFSLETNTDGTIAFWTDDGTNSNPTELSSVTVLDPGVWYHITVTVSGTTRILYINGSTDTYTDTGEAIGTSDTPFTFGAKKDGVGVYGDFLDGSLDDLRLYDYALTEAQVDQLHSGQDINAVGNRGFSEPAPGNGGATGAPSACNDITPQGAPNLYQLDSKKNSADLFFTTVINGASSYEVFYGTSPEANQFSYKMPYENSAWVSKLSINGLNSNQTYYFKVRASTNCTAGEFSNIMQLKTTKSGQKSYYKSVLARVASVAVGAMEGGCTYTVKGGDSYWSIAKAKLGDGRKYLQLIALNPKVKTLRSGMTINISCQ